MEMSYLRGACGVTRLDGERNKSIYERCGMGSHANGMNCGVMEWLKRNTLRWFGHIERMGSKEFVKKVDLSESVGTNRRGRPPGCWRARVTESLCERGATRGGRAGSSRRSAWTGGGGDFSAVATPLGDTPGRSEASGL